MRCAMLSPGDIISGGTTGGLWWIAGLSGAALMVSAVLLAFGYVWGTMFRNPQLIAYVKAELLEILVTGAMLAIIFAGVGAMSGLTVGDVMPQQMMPAGVEKTTGIYDAAAAYYQQVDNDMSGWLGMNYIMNMYVDQVASVTPYARPLGVGMVASPMAGFASPIKQLLYNMTVALALAFIINHAQLGGLRVRGRRVPEILPAPRRVPPLLHPDAQDRRHADRRLGRVPLHIPAAFAHHVQHVLPERGGPLLTFNSMLTQYMSDTSTGSFQSTFSSFFTGNFSDIGSSVMDLVGGVLGGLGTVFQKLIGTMMLFFLIVPCAAVSWAFAIGFIVPTFNIIIFTQAARGLSKVFGEEVDVSSLTRMI